MEIKDLEIFKSLHPEIFTKLDVTTEKIERAYGDAPDEALYEQLNEILNPLFMAWRMKFDLATRSLREEPTEWRKMMDSMYARDWKKDGVSALFMPPSNENQYSFTITAGEDSISCHGQSFTPFDQNVNYWREEQNFVVSFLEGKRIRTVGFKIEEIASAKKGIHNFIKIDGRDITFPYLPIRAKNAQIPQNARTFVIGATSKPDMHKVRDRRLLSVPLEII